jgi:hypothetical protein
MIHLLIFVSTVLFSTHIHVIVNYLLCQCGREVTLICEDLLFLFMSTVLLYLLRMRWQVGQLLLLLLGNAKSKWNLKRLTRKSSVSWMTNFIAVKTVDIISRNGETNAPCHISTSPLIHQLRVWNIEESVGGEVWCVDGVEGILAFTLYLYFQTCVKGIYLPMRLTDWLLVALLLISLTKITSKDLFWPPACNKIASHSQASGSVQYLSYISCAL